MKTKFIDKIVELAYYGDLCCRYRKEWLRMALVRLLTQDEHMVAFDWLEDHLEDKLFEFDVDDIYAMEEQVLVTNLTN